MGPKVVIWSKKSNFQKCQKILKYVREPGLAILGITKSPKQHIKKPRNSKKSHNSFAVFWALLDLVNLENQVWPWGVCKSISNDKFKTWKGHNLCTHGGVYFVFLRLEGCRQSPQKHVGR